MNARKYFSLIAVSLTALVLVRTVPAQAPPEPAPTVTAPAYKDGVYEGKYSFVTVKVTIAQGRISDIQLVRHGGGGERYAEMVEPLIPLMLEKQSTDVDTVSGATVSSNNLRYAVDAALEKAKDD